MSNTIVFTAEIAVWGTGLQADYPLRKGSWAPLKTLLSWLLFSSHCTSWPRDLVIGSLLILHCCSSSLQLHKPSETPSISYSIHYSLPKSSTDPQVISSQICSHCMSVCTALSIISWHYPWWLCPLPLTLTWQNCNSSDHLSTCIALKQLNTTVEKLSPLLPMYHLTSTEP